MAIGKAFLRVSSLITPQGESMVLTSCHSEFNVTLRKKKKEDWRKGVVSLETS